MDLPPHVKLIENSLLAGLAAWKMKTRSVALVLGNTIHLYNVSAAAFKASPGWVRHELKHVEQYRKLGLLQFLARYAYYSARYGYFNNPLEIEARAAEADPAE